MLGLWLAYLERGGGGGWSLLGVVLWAWVNRQSAAFPVDQFDSIFRYSAASFFLVEGAYIHACRKKRVLRFISCHWDVFVCVCVCEHFTIGARSSSTYSFNFRHSGDFRWRPRLAIFSFGNSSNTYHYNPAAAIWLLMSPMSLLFRLSQLSWLSRLSPMSRMSWMSWMSCLSGLQFVAYLMGSQLPRPHFVFRLWLCHPIDSIRSKNFNNNRTEPVSTRHLAEVSRFPFSAIHFPPFSPALSHRILSQPLRLAVMTLQSDIHLLVSAKNCVRNAKRKWNTLSHTIYTPKSLMMENYIGNV